MKIAFRNMGGANWLGGALQLESLCDAVRSLHPKPGLALVIAQGTPAADFEPLEPLVDEVICVPDRLAAPAAPARSFARRALGRIGRFRRRPPQAMPPLRANPLDTCLKQHGVDCYLTTAWGAVPELSTPLIAHFYDFQFRHLPELFSPDERALREAYFRDFAAACVRALAFSRDIAGDFAVFLPQQAHKVRAVPVAVGIPPAVYEVDPASDLAVYHLPDKFFYLPNQFWQHKNHAVVFQALQILGQRSLWPTVVCTGALTDERRPNFITDLVQQLSRLNIRAQVILLGIVPRRHVFSLMRQSVCVLNPTLFEGVGLSVVEAKCLGKRLLVSDLPALREHGAPLAAYFDPQDAKDLADKMETIWSTTNPGPDTSLERQAREALPGWQRDYGQAFVDICHEACGQ